MVDTSFQPDWFSKPGDTLLTLMEQKELTSENLALKLGCSNAVVRGLLAGTVAVDANLAAALSKHVGGTSKFWQVREAKYQHALSRAAEAVPTVPFVPSPHATMPVAGTVPVGPSHWLLATT